MPLGADGLLFALKGWLAAALYDNTNLGDPRYLVLLFLLLRLDLGGPKVVHP